MKGGYHPEGRLASALEEIRIEAQLARQVRRRSQRDRAFDDIARMAQAAVDLIRHAGAVTSVEAQP